MLFLLRTSRQLLWTPLTPPQTLSGWRLVERSELHSDLSCIIVAWHHGDPSTYCIGLRLVHANIFESEALNTRIIIIIIHHANSPGTSPLAVAIVDWPLKVWPAWQKRKIYLQLLRSLALNTKISWSASCSDDYLPVWLWHRLCRYSTEKCIVRGCGQVTRLLQQGTTEPSRGSRPFGPFVGAHLLVAFAPVQWWVGWKIYLEAGWSSQCLLKFTLQPTKLATRLVSIVSYLFVMLLLFR